MSVPGTVWIQGSEFDVQCSMFVFRKVYGRSRKVLEGPGRSWKVERPGPQNPELRTQAPYTVFQDNLPPASWHSSVTARASLPTAVNPNRVRIRRHDPMSGQPNPAAIPDPFAADPHAARSGCDDHCLDGCSRRVCGHNRVATFHH